MAQQLYQLGVTALFGLLLGIFYDILRTVRRHVKKGPFTIAADIVFWLALTVGLFAQTMTIGQGGLRIFMLASNLGGAALYFALFSPFVLQVFGAILEKTLKVARFIGRPVGKTWSKCEKFSKRTKRVFQKRVNQYIIKVHLSRKKKLGAKNAQEGGGAVEKKKGQYLYETSRIGASGVRSSYPSWPTQANRTGRRAKNPTKSHRVRVRTRK